MNFNSKLLCQRAMKHDIQPHLTSLPNQYFHYFLPITKVYFYLFPCRFRYYIFTSNLIFSNPNKVHICRYWSKDAERIWAWKRSSADWLFFVFHFEIAVLIFLGQPLFLTVILLPLLIILFLLYWDLFSIPIKSTFVDTESL